MKTERKLGNGVILVIEWHLCLECKRMINLNREAFDLVLVKGYYGYAHHKCPPLKQRLIAP